MVEEKLKKIWANQQNWAGKCRNAPGEGIKPCGGRNKTTSQEEHNASVPGGTKVLWDLWNCARCPEFLFWSKIFVTRPCKILWFRKALFQPSCLCSVVTHWRRRLTSVCPCSCSWRSRRSTWCRLFRGCGAPRPSWSAFCKYGSSQVYCVPGTERENITSRTTTES